MNFETRNLQMAIARQLHDRGCADKPTTHLPDEFDKCLDWPTYVIDSAMFLGYIMKDLITDIVIPTRKEEDERVAYRIRAELVCCDITERMDAEARKGRWDDENGTYLMPQSWRDLKKSHDFHPICFYGGWAAQIALAGPGRRYWCSQGGEFELNEGGGFQTCCDQPEGHIILGPEADGE